MPQDPLIESLSREGSVVAHGEFTLDRARAREKMRRYQLPNPHAYVLELVQCAVLRGAARIDFRIDTDDMRMRFDGPPFTTTELSGLEAAALESGADPLRQSVRQLALGLTAAMGVRPRFIRVDTGGMRLEMRPGRTDAIGRAPARKSSAPPTLIHVRDSLRARQLMEFLRRLIGQTSEGEFLLKQCAFCPVPIHLDGRLINRSPSEYVEAGRVAVEGDGISGVGGFRPGDNQSEVDVMKDGALIETIHLTSQDGSLPAGPLPYRALVSSRDLIKNVSQTGIVRDEAYEKMKQVVLLSRKASIERLCKELVGSPESLPWLHGELRDELLVQAELHKQETLQAEGDAYPRCLCSAPVWETATGSCRRVSLRELLEAAERFGGNIPSASERRPGFELEGAPLVLFQDHSWYEKLKKVLDHRIVNVTRRIHNQIKRDQNRARWREKKAKAVLGDGRWISTRRLEGENLLGEAGILMMDRSPSIRFIKDGCELADIRPSLPLWGLEAAVEGDFTPSENYDGIRKDAPCAQALLAVLHVLRGLYEALAMGSAGQTNAWTAAALSGFLELVTTPEYPVAFLKGFGFSEVRAREAAAGCTTFDILASDSPVLLAPCFPDGRGGFQSLQRLKEKRQDGPIEYVAAGDDSGHAGRDALRLDQAGRETLERVLGGDALKKRDVAAQPRSAPTSRPEREGLMAEMRRERAFLDALEGHLTWIQERDLEAATRLPRWNLRLGDPAAFAVCDSAGVTLQRKHRLVRRALDAFDRQPVVLSLLAPILFTEVNRWIQEVTGQRTRGEDMRLQALLARLVLAGSGDAQDAGIQASGALDVVGADGSVSGWAVHQDGGSPLTVRFYLEDRFGLRSFIGSATADQPLPEGMTSCPVPGPHGFAFQIPKKDLNGTDHKMLAHVVVDGRMVELEGSPRKFKSAVPYAMSPIGCFDGVDAAGLAWGWSIDPNTPDVAVAIHFYIDGPAGQGEFVGGIGADQPRPDVNKAIGYAGDHGFRYQIPAEHLDGSEHLLYAYALDTAGGHNPALSGSPMRFSVSA